MNGKAASAGLELTEEEAYALLTLCMMSAHGLDALSESALRKLAAYCKSNHIDSHYSGLGGVCEFEEAG